MAPVRSSSDNGHIVTKLQGDVISLSTFVERADKNITKLTEVSSRISELLAVHGARLESQEKTAGQLQDLLEKRRHEFDGNIKDVYIRAEKMEKDLYKEIDDTYNKVLSEIKEMRIEGNKQHDEIKRQVNRLEKWMWTVIGGFTVALFVFEVFLKHAI
jgi:hypothetical protein